MGEKTKKEEIWEELKAMEKDTPINMVSLSKKIGCSISYLSSMFRYALESGFLKFHESGNYEIRKIPNYPKFQKSINAMYKKYRKETGGPRGSRPRRKMIPKDFKFEINKDSIVNIIKALIQENKELKEKVKKLLKYSKLLKEKIDQEKETFFEEEID